MMLDGDLGVGNEKKRKFWFSKFSLLLEASEATEGFSRSEHSPTGSFRKHPEALSC